MGTQARKTRGLFERPHGSGIWWINYYVKGKQHREKVGRKSDAIALYQKRKADARRGVKLPELLPQKVTTFGELANDAVAYAKAHLRTRADYDWKERALREEFGSRSAAEITPQEIDRFLAGRCKTPATANRFRAFFSLCYRLGMENGRATSNPARLVRMRREDNARLRFLSKDEYKELSNTILRDFPEQHSAFVVSVYTGMRWGEQFSLTWNQVDMRRKIIRLTQTKNGSARNVPLNSTALDALKAQQTIVPHKPTDEVFPEAGDYCRFWFEPAIKEAGITGYTWHCNRHTFCSWLAMAGVSLKEIQTLAGHKTITMAARYAHLSPDAAASASERMVMYSTA
jgi:integrase